MPCVFYIGNSAFIFSRLNKKWLHYSWTDLGLISIIILQFLDEKDPEGVRSLRSELINKFYSEADINVLDNLDQRQRHHSFDHVPIVRIRFLLTLDWAWCAISNICILLEAFKTNWVTLWIQDRWKFILKIFIEILHLSNIYWIYKIGSLIAVRLQVFLFFPTMDLFERCLAL